MGFSVGGNVLLKYLGEEGDAAGASLAAAVAISVPFDLAGGARHLEATAMGGFYARYFLRSLRRKVREKEELLAPLVDLDAALGARTLWEFDDAVTAPLHGFRDAREYYQLAGSGPLLNHIRVPTLLVHAYDDPFLPSGAIPLAAIRAAPALTEAFTPRGGHVGFLAGGVPGRPRFWAEEESSRFLRGYLLGQEPG
jgi:predicted alpha/beta-fold hydrolase